MPASQVHTTPVETNGAAEGSDMSTSDTSTNDAPAGGSENPTVHDFLEMALEAAAEQEMSTSELMGIFFYYAHNIAESYRQSVLNPDDQSVSQTGSRASLG